MNLTDVKNFADSRGYRLVGSTLVGVFQGYPFAAAFKNAGRTSVLNVTLTLTKAPKNRALRQLKGALPRGVSVNRFNAAAVMLACSGGDDSLFDLFAQGMQALTGLLREEQLTPPEKCPLCGRTGCDAAALTAVRPVLTAAPVHKSCCEGRSFDAVSRAELNEQRGSYLPGLLGALLGGLVGAIPSVLTIWFTQTVYGVLYALIPLAAWHGYRLLGGRMNRVASAAAVLSSVVQLFMVEWILFYFQLHEFYDIWPSPIDAVRYYYQIVPLGDMAADMAIPAVFTVLGLFIVFGQITRTNKTAVTDANALLESMVPLGPVYS